MESYGEWRVTVYDVIFGELKFLDSHTTPNCYVAKVWRVSR